MKEVVIVIPDGDIDISSITGSFQLLHWANEYWQKLGRRPMIRIRLAGFETQLNLDFGFFTIHPLHVTEIEKIDLVIIPSLRQDYHAVIQKNKELTAWIREQYKSGAEIASVCTGAFLLAATGLLDGKKCSVHWDVVDELQKLFPKVQASTDVVTISGKGIYTNGGGFSFLNLALLIIERYFDRPTAILCSKMFQIEIDRTSQSPFAIFQAQKNHGDDIVGQAQAYIEENLSEKISFEELAARLAISRRNFDRRFIKATGNTPVEYLHRVKVEVAKSALEKGRKTIFEVMTDVGYTDDKAFREVFKKITGVSPWDYRAKYNKAAAN